MSEWSTEIFKESGSDAVEAFNQTVYVGLTNFLFTFVAFFFVDKLGRKPLLLVGAAGMGVSLFLLGLTPPSGEGGNLWFLSCLLLYVAFFAIALGPVVWVVIAEIFPTHVRGRAVSIAALASWLTGFAMNLLYPILQEHFPESIFFIYAGICAATVVFVAALVPEVKGKSLEEIEEMWKK